MSTAVAAAQLSRSPAARRLRALESGSDLEPSIAGRLESGYLDPGNWATDLAAGSQHGFNLLAVVLFASAVGAFLQALTVRLSLASGKDLASLIRDTFPRPIALFLWFAIEVAIILTDLCELVGGALAFHLLFGLPLIPGAILTGVIGPLILLLPSRQGRTHEVVLGAMAIIVAVCFAVKLAIAQPDMAAQHLSALGSGAGSICFVPGCWAAHCESRVGDRLDHSALPRIPGQLRYPGFGGHAF